MTMQTEDLQFELSRFEAWAKNADAKVGVILAFDGVILAAIVKHAFNVVSDPKSPNYIEVAYVISLVLLVWSIGKALWAISPRLNHGQRNISVLYFRDVSKLELSQYKKKMSTLTVAKYREEIVAQMHAIAKIADKRMVAFKDSVVLLTISLLIAGGVEIWLRLTS